jgi:hypothetical protein
MQVNVSRTVQSAPLDLGEAVGDPLARMIVGSTATQRAII